MKRYAPVFLVLVLIATKLYWSWWHEHFADATPAPAIHPVPRPATTPTDTPAPGSLPPAPGFGPAPTSPTLRRLADAEDRAWVMQKIAAARARRFGAPTPNIPSAPYGGDEPPMSPEDIRASFKEVIPLLADCYEAAQPRLAVKSGTIRVQMRAVGEPDVGTLIDDASLDGGGGLLDDAELADCLHQTLLSVELPPMPEGGVVEITYPISFQESGD
jgi:hypothetical protein